MSSSSTTLVSSPPSLSNPPTRRTNALGWARSDCHTCQLTSHFCNRRRPRCDACTDKGIICGGYVQKLRWQTQGLAGRSRAGGKILVANPDHHRVSKKVTGYSFVQEDGRRTEKRKSVCRGSEPVLQDRPAELPSSLRAEADSTIGTDSTLERAQSEAEADLAPVLYSHQPRYFQFPTSTLEEIDFFKWTFSSMTLTYDIKANPWQACLAQIDYAPFLLDGVRALSIRHRSHLEDTQESLSVLELKDKALSSYAQSLVTVPLEVGISVSLILIGIDYADTALSNWAVHLQGVYRMLEAAGGIHYGDRNMHIRAQIAQLVWYDTVISLLSRRDHIFPREYIECVLSWKNESHWSLFALNGFPDTAFLLMYDIAEAAAHASSLSDGQVAGLEMKIWLTRFEMDEGASDKETSALTDCWRLGLLLYCTRVFHQGEGVKQKARVFAEEIMWLVHELPPYSNKQKQALMPLFLAASEMDSFRFRRIALEFCARWKKKSGIWLNESVIELLRTVWAAVDANPDKDIWWGDCIDPASDSSYLFG